MFTRSKKSGHFTLVRSYMHISNSFNRSFRSLSVLSSSDVAFLSNSFKLFTSPSHKSLINKCCLPCRSWEATLSSNLSRVCVICFSSLVWFILCNVRTMLVVKVSQSSLSLFPQAAFGVPHHLFISPRNHYLLFFPIKNPS